jgi:hypothetical protein
MAKKYTGWAYISGAAGEGADGPVGAVQYRKDGASTEQTGSVNFVFSEGAAALFLTGTMHVDGTITSNNFDVVNHTVSYLSASGDSKFGDTAGDTHQFTGSVEVLGQISSSAEVSASAFWGDGSNLTGLSTSPAGADTQLQFNQNGSFAANSGLVYDGSGSLSTDKDHSDTTANANIVGIEIDFDKTGASTSNNTMYGLKVDMDNTTATNGINYMYGLNVTPTLTHAADAGSAYLYGANISAQGGTNGSALTTGARIEAAGGDFVYGLQLDVEDGANNVDFRIESSADAGDFFQIQTTTHGATTITTQDDDATAAHLTFNVDGNITLDPVGGTVVVDGDAAIGEVMIPSGTLHVQSARAVVSPHAYADDLIVETAGTAGGISVLNDDSNQNWIAMGHTSDNITSHWSDSYVSKIASFGSDNIYYRTAIASGNGSNALVLDHSQNTHVLGNLTVTGSLLVKDQARHLIYSTPGTGNFTSTAAAVNIFADGSWTTPPTYASGNITANDIVFDQTTGRFTTSQPPRLYSVTCSITTLSTSQLAMINLTATVNGSTVFKLGDHSAHNSVDPVNLVMTFLVEMDASEYLEIWVDQTASTYHSDVQWLSLSIHAV